MNHNGVEYDAPIITPKIEEPVSPFAKLTPRQRQVARGLALGFTCAELAKQYECSVKTMDTHRGAVLRLCDVSNTVKLCHLAIQYGEIEVPSC